MYINLFDINQQKVNILINITLNLFDPNQTSSLIFINLYNKGLF